MKKSIFWGVAFICAALLLIVDGVGTGLGFLNDIPVVRIILGVACLSWTVNELYKKRIPHIFFPLSFIFMLFESEIAALCGVNGGEIMSNWLVLLCALLLTIGTSIIFSKSSKFCKWVFSGDKHGHKIMGKSTKYIDCADFTHSHIENNMGATEVFFENVDAYMGNGSLSVENNMGSVVIKVPCEWHIVTDIENNMGSIKNPSTGNVEGKVIKISGENNMGSISIETV